MGLSLLFLKSETYTHREVATIANTSGGESADQEPKDFCIDVPILTYHHIQPFEDAEPKNQTAQTVAPGNFDYHMQWLKSRGYTFVSLNDLVEALQNQTTFEGKPVVVTLDDSYKDAYTYAYTIAQKHDVILNIGVITGLVGNPEHLTGSQIREMEKSGYATFYNHTWTHRNLKSSNTDMIRSQITTADEQLAQWSTNDIDVLFYPYGVYGDEVIEILGNLDYDVAVSLVFNDKNTTHCASKMYELSRLRVGNSGPQVYNLD